MPFLAEESCALRWFGRCGRWVVSPPATTFLLHMLSLGAFLGGPLYCTDLLKPYVDGRLAGEVSGSFTPRVDRALYIGRRQVMDPMAQATFSGSIDEVAIYGRALGADEVARHHDAGVEGTVHNEFPPFAWLR